MYHTYGITCLSLLSYFFTSLHCRSSLSFFVVFPYCLPSLHFFIVFLHCLSLLYFFIGFFFIVFLLCLSSSSFFVVFLHCLLPLPFFIVLLHRISSLSFLAVFVLLHCLFKCLHSLSFFAVFLLCLLSFSFLLYFYTVFLHFLSVSLWLYWLSRAAELNSCLWYTTITYLFLVEIASLLSHSFQQLHIRECSYPTALSFLPLNIILRKRQGFFFSLCGYFLFF